MGCECCISNFTHRGTKVTPATRNPAICQIIPWTFILVASSNSWDMPRASFDLNKDTILAVSHLLIFPSLISLLPSCSDHCIIDQRLPSCANVTMICDQCWFVISRDLILIIGLSPSPVSAPSDFRHLSPLSRLRALQFSSSPDNCRLCELWAAAVPWSDVITASPRLQIKTVERVTQHTISLALSVFTMCCPSNVYDMTGSSLMLAPRW